MNTKIYIRVLKYFNYIRGANKLTYTDGEMSLSTLVTKTQDFVDFLRHVISFGINVLDTS